MVISRCGLHGLHVPMLVEELHYGHVNGIVPTQHLQMAGKTARDRASNLNCAKSKRVESMVVTRHGQPGRPALRNVDKG